MTDDTLCHFIERTRAVFGPLTTETVAAVRTELERLAQSPPTEPWLRELEDESPASKELHRDRLHGFVLLAHTEPPGLYRPPHDHGRNWVIYALVRGEMEIGTYARVVDDEGRARLVKRDSTRLRPGEARVYLPGDIHDTRTTSGPALLLRLTERDLRQDDQGAHRITRYVERDGVFSAGPA